MPTPLKSRKSPWLANPRGPGIILLLLIFGAPSLAAAEKAEEDPFEIQIPEISVKSGQGATAQITVKTKPGWKWNKEYPASAVVTAEGPCDITTPKIGKGGKSIELKGKDAVFPIGLKGTAPGKAKVTVTANFSICNEETCRIYRKRVLGFPVKVD